VRAQRTYLSPRSWVYSFNRVADGKLVHQGICLDHEKPVYTPQTLDAGLATTNLKLHRTDHHREAHAVTRGEVRDA
jgi:hypothetical protein